MLLMLRGASSDLPFQQTELSSYTAVSLLCWAPARSKTSTDEHECATSKKCLKMYSQVLTWLVLYIICEFTKHQDC